MIIIQELLYNYGLDRNARIKLVRHKDNCLLLYGLYRYKKQDFLGHQKIQSNDVFSEVDFILTFKSNLEQYA